MSVKVLNNLGDILEGLWLHDFWWSPVLGEDVLNILSHSHDVATTLDLVLIGISEESGASVSQGND